MKDGRLFSAFADESTWKVLSQCYGLLAHQDPVTAVNILAKVAHLNPITYVSVCVRVSKHTCV